MSFAQQLRVLHSLRVIPHAGAKDTVVNTAGELSPLMRLRV